MRLCYEARRAQREGEERDCETCPHECFSPGSERDLRPELGRVLTTGQKLQPRRLPWAADKTKPTLPVHGRRPGWIGIFAERAKPTTSHKPVVGMTAGAQHD